MTMIAAYKAWLVQLSMNDKIESIICVFTVWGCASAAVIVISLAGLIGVAAVPLMKQVFYSHILHFLVALAVGSLTGDAALHLLPHVSLRFSAANKVRGRYRFLIWAPI